MTSQVGIAVGTGVVHVHALVNAARYQAATERAAATKGYTISCCFITALIGKSIWKSIAAIVITYCIPTSYGDDDYCVEEEARSSSWSI